jgi:hypothetical protein
VVERRGRLGFALEALEALVIGRQTGGDELGAPRGDPASGPSFVDGAHTTLAKEALDPIVAICVCSMNLGLSGGGRALNRSHSAFD